MLRPIYRWLFYGHVWIALAAAALGRQSTYLNGQGSDLRWQHLFLFLATLGVYSLHRSLSFHRARGEPTAKRYGIVRDFPAVSILIGSGAMILALGLLVVEGLIHLWPVLLALPFTFFYLIPVYPGGPRLRDLPYLKVVWVALSWTVMTHLFVVLPGRPGIWEGVIRFAFTLSVALLFDLRDVALDRRQGVRTIAAADPTRCRYLAVGLLLACSVGSLLVYPFQQSVPLAFAYLLAGAIGWWTHPGRDEDWYAILVNGILLLPPLALFLG
jgi:hypothetical protein